MLLSTIIFAQYLRGWGSVIAFLSLPPSVSRSHPHPARSFGCRLPLLCATFHDMRTTAIQTTPTTTYQQQRSAPPGLFSFAYIWYK